MDGPERGRGPAPEPGSPPSLEREWSHISPSETPEEKEGGRERREDVWNRGCMERVYGIEDVWNRGCMERVYGIEGVSNRGCMERVYGIEGVWNRGCME